MSSLKQDQQITYTPNKTDMGYVMGTVDIIGTNTYNYFAPCGGSCVAANKLTLQSQWHVPFGHGYMVVFCYVVMNRKSLYDWLIEVLMSI